MNQSDFAVEATRPSVCRKTVPFVLLTAFFAALPLMAQQSPQSAVPNVADNIAPRPAPDQPLPFSHKTHLASGPACRACHTNPAPKIRMSYPATSTCMSCHSTIAKDKPAIMTLKDFSVVDMEVPWVPVYAITPGVTWSHGAHLDAGLQCETCHGDVSQVDEMAETKAILAMATCISCHEARGAQAACATCHAWPTDRDLGFE